MKPLIDPESTSFLLIDIARMTRAEFEARVGAAELGITAGEARTLAGVARHGPIRQNCLAELSGQSRMSVTVFLDGLEAAGLIRRIPDPDDRRCKVVEVTEAATPLLQELRTIGDEVRAVMRGAMPETEWEALRNSLRHIRNNQIAARQSAATRGTR
ncbi:MarR family winged helix-turn-helix transcriptional regulator [Pontibaca methylaminivorans]|uniref:DNA-binding transcriptional regulator, MarR family n=1 Tax=Pontibaca methylaminivorans TaxID=515897 RepID=A0A1R3X094_9RHOB|nr:MarR family transcriptional regulator [Pontibaca methylaminivorans]SIT83229.1 DNA-binding transcriptional regulator, MarR family [Pontibaca methylaminivorans]